MSACNTTVTVEKQGQARVVRFAPLTEFPEQVTMPLEQELTDVVREPDVSMVVVNFGGVTLISSHMLGVLVRLRSQATKRKVRLCLAGLSEINLRLFQLTRLDALFQIFASEGDALAAGG